MTVLVVSSLSFPYSAKAQERKEYSTTRHSILASVGDFFKSLFLSSPKEKDGSQSDEIIPINPQSSSRSSSSPSVIPLPRLPEASSEGGKKGIQTISNSSSSAYPPATTAVGQVGRGNLKTDITRGEVMSLLKQSDNRNLALIRSIITAPNPLTNSDSLSVNQSIFNINNKISRLEQREYVSPRQIEHVYTAIGRSVDNKTSFDDIDITNSTITSSSFSGTTGTFTGVFSGASGTFSSSLTIGSQLVVSGTATSTLAGDTSFDSGTLYIDSLNNRVGIASSSPSETLSVNGATYFSQISAPSNTTDRLYNTSGDLYWNGNLIGSASVGNWTSSSGNVYRSSGNVGIGTTSPYAKLSIHANSSETNTTLFNIASSTASATTSLFTVLNNGNVGIGTATPRSILDLGAGPVEDGYFQPLTWSGGSGYTLTGGHSTFNSTIDNLGGFGYNQKNSPVAGDPQFALGFESDYNNLPAGRDTEFYYAWNGPVGVAKEAATGNTRAGRDRRPMGFNTSLGTAAGNSVTRPIGYTESYFDVDKFSVGGTGAWSNDFLLDMTSTQARSPTWMMNWHGSANFDYNLALGGNITSSTSTGESSIGGNLTISSTNASFNFNKGSTNTDSIYSAGTAVSGDTGVRLGRNGYNNSDYMAFGASAGGTLFASNGFFLDLVRSTAPAQPFSLRYSNNGGAIGGGTYTTLMTATPNTQMVDFPITNDVVVTTGTVSGGAVSIAGGLSVLKKIATNDTITVSQAGASNYSRMSASGSGASLDLVTNTIGNYKKVRFGYGATPTFQWSIGYGGYYPNTWLVIGDEIAGGAVSISGNKNLLIGGISTSDMSGTSGLRIEGTTEATSLTVASLQTAGGGAVAKNLLVGGSVGIATTSPWRTLSVTGSMAVTDLTAGGAGDYAVCINNTTKELTNAGATGCVVSSKRFKENISELDSGLDELMQLKPSKFTYIGQTGEHIGLIAEDVNVIDPRLVEYEADGVTPRTVRYLELSGLLIKSIQDLNVKIDNLSHSSTTTTSTAQRATSDVAQDGLFSWVVGKFTSTFGIVFGQDKVVVKNLCAKKSDGSEVCIDGDQLQILLDKNAIIQTSSSASSSSSSSTVETGSSSSSSSSSASSESSSSSSSNSEASSFSSEILSSSSSAESSSESSSLESSSSSEIISSSSSSVETEALSSSSSSL